MSRQPFCPIKLNTTSKSSCISKRRLNKRSTHSATKWSNSSSCGLGWMSTIKVWTPKLLCSGKQTIPRVLNCTSVQRVYSFLRTSFRVKNARHTARHKVVYVWVCDMSERKICTNGKMIMTKASRRVHMKLANKSRSDGKKIKFSYGWLEYFKTTWKLSVLCLHGEGRVVDETTLQYELRGLQEKNSRLNAKDFFNCEEFALFWQMAPSRTIAAPTFSGRKTKKEVYNSCMLECRRVRKVCTALYRNCSLS